MSNTRTAPIGSALHQERWASSPALDHGLKANLVALRATLVESATYGELIWALQYLSMQPGGLRRAAVALRTSEATLAQYCLDPESNLDADAPRISRFLTSYAEGQSAGVADTKVTSAIYSSLDYCHASRCLGLVSGPARIGKTFAARHWCGRNPGRARYVQVPSSRDDLSFFVAIARAIGIAIESNVKIVRLRPRIEAALQSGRLELVLDDGQYLWPDHYYRLGRPSRICWLMTALVNQRVPVCILVTPDFFQTQKRYERKSGWASGQFVGRIERFIELPSKLGITDLEAVARACLPSGNQKAIETLADYANLSTKHVAAIEHAINQARYIARQRGRETPEWPDVQQAIRESALPSDAGLAAALKGFGGVSRRGGMADLSPAARGRSADVTR